MEDENLVSQFQAITNETPERSRFYLEAVNWDLNAALSSFYDNSAGAVDVEEPMLDARAGGPSNEAYDQDVGKDLAKMHNKKTAPVSSSRRLHSLADYQKEQQSGDSEEEGQEFYAGGSEQSGEVILGPGKKKAEDIVKNIFQNARKHGAVETEAAGSSMKSSENSSYFSGSGYKLGETSEDHQFIAGQEKPEENTQLNTVLKLWKDGFTVGDGPLRSYHDEENKEFLQAVVKGEVPQELLRMAKGGEVNVDMEDHKHEEYKPVKKKLAAFAGEGRALGSATPTVVSSYEPQATQSSAVDVSVDIDESLPITTVRIQLGDGRRVTQKFNHSHTIAQIYSFVRNYGNGSSRQFKLMTTFPNKELKEDATTLKDGNLLNAVIVQRFI